MRPIAIIALLVGCSSEPSILVEDAGTSATDARPGSDARDPVTDGGQPDTWEPVEDAFVAEDTTAPDARDATTAVSDAPIPPDAGSDAGSIPPVDGGPVPDRSAVVQLALGSTHTCLLRASGLVRCWGNPGIGDGRPVVTDATEIAALDRLSYARLTDGSVVRWSGASGPTTVVPASEYPADPAMPSGCYTGADGFSPYAEVYAGTCGRRMDGTVHCYDHNEHGQIGRDTGMFTSGLPCGEVRLDGASMDAVVMGSSGNHVCAGLSDGRVVCWGWNSEGQLGTWVPGLMTWSPVEPDAYLTE